MSRVVVYALALWLAAGPAWSQPPPGLEKTSCTICHADPDLFDEESTAMVQGWAIGAHAAVGVSCHDCHGGNPDPELADDDEHAMDPDFAENPFHDPPARTEIPDFCGRCHSDPVYMKRFHPDARIDQEAEYWTSFHGKALRKGDRRVATCVSCHGVHGILPADDPRSPVYPTRVADTCGHCHEDAKTMEGTELPDGQPIPLDQKARWRQSVHGQALLDRGDLFAPTCNDCHGNHGATPPGLESVTFVCGQCHGREAELLRASPKHAGLVRHNELFRDDEALTSCASCHEEPDPAAKLTDVSELGQCTACHGNHAIARPTVAMLAALPATPCTICHGRLGTEEVPELPEKLANFRRQRDRLLARAEELGLGGEERFDWLVDRALELPFHTETVTGDGANRVVLRPEFGRLFRKFRVGKTRTEYTDPRSGETRSVRVRRCSDCHAEKPQLADKAVGLGVAHVLTDRLLELETAVARAERILLAAKRGGVAVTRARAELDRAIDSQIELQVVLHTFSVDEGSPFLETHAEGMKHATAALEASHEAFEELGVRRTGLAWSLLFIALVLVGLALRIRDQSRRAAGAGH